MAMMAITTSEGEAGHDTIMRRHAGRDYIQWRRTAMTALKAAVVMIRVFGGLGDDRIYAGPGADWIDGGGGC